MNKSAFPKNLRTLRKEAAGPAWVLLALIVVGVALFPLVAIFVTLDRNEPRFAIWSLLAYGCAMFCVGLIWKLHFFDFLWHLHVRVWRSWWFVGICMLPLTLFLVALLTDFLFSNSARTVQFVHQLRSYFRQGFKRGFSRQDAWRNVSNIPPGTEG